MNQLIRICASSVLPTLLVALLAGCGAQPQKTTSTEAASTNIATSKPTPSKEVLPLTVAQGSFSSDTLYSLLVAEVAASRQQFPLTLKNYVEQARETDDKAVIARAARIAQFFRAQADALEMGLLWLTHDESNIEAITLVSNAYLEQGKPLIALDYTEKLLLLFSPEEEPNATKSSTKDSGAFTETIANLSKQADKDTITILIQRFQQLDILYPSVTGIKVGLSVLHQINDSADEALVWVQRALVQEPARTSAIIQEALLLQQSQQSALAISKLEAQLEKDPSNSRLRLVYARLLSTSDIAAAYEQFTLLSKQSPKQFDMKFSRAILATELNKMLIATELFEELLAVQYRVDNVNFYLGHIAESLDKLPSALSYYQAVKAGANLLPSKNRAARVMILQGKVAAAQSLFAQLRLQSPKKTEPIYVTETNLLVQNKADNAALLILNIAIDEFPDNRDLRYNRSTVYERQDQLALMESDLRHVLTIDADNVMALNGLGYFLATRTERYEEAYQLISRALKLQPNDAAIIDSMGWVVFKMGRIDEAIGYLRKAFDLYPDPEVAAHLGEALWSKGNKQAAKTLWENNLHANPNAPEILETLKRLGVTL
ncbi:MAG: tetratricopeptide (TPR) repeat protein [Candidatus Endobugula sp.]|jgi:tetratricopeptide (TPR) repeat protein